MARPRRVFGSHGPGRLTTWIAPAAQDFVAVASAGATILGSFAFEEPVTIIRVRGFAGIKVNSQAASVNLVGAIGMGVVSAEAFGVGITAVPEPWNDGDWGGWFMWRSFAGRLEFDDASGVVFTDWGLEIDSKAMRRVKTNEVVVIVAESITGAFDVSPGMRMLVKLS